MVKDEFKISGSKNFKRISTDIPKSFLFQRVFIIGWKIVLLKRNRHALERNDQRDDNGMGYGQKLFEIVEM